MVIPWPQLLVGVIALGGCVDFDRFASLPDGASSADLAGSLAFDLAGSDLTLGPNLITNPSFESGTSGWNAFGGTIMRVTDVSIAGAAALRVCSSGSGPLLASIDVFGPGDEALFPVGASFTCSAWLRSDSPGLPELTLVLRERDPSTVLRDHVGLPFKLGPSWQIGTHAATMAEAAHDSLIFMIRSEVAAPAGACFDLDLVEVRRS